MTPEQAAKDWTISDEPLTPERAALMAAHVFDMAADASHFPEQAAALVQVADGWTRLHTALAHAPKEIEPAPGEPVEIADLPVEVRQLVHAVDAMRDGWAEADMDRKQELWRRVHEANDAVWSRTY